MLHAPATFDPHALQSENDRLRREVGSLELERRNLQLKLRVLQPQSVELAPAALPNTRRHRRRRLSG